MKRMIGMLLILCVAIGFASCAKKLPDPVPVAEAFVKGLKDPEGELAQSVLQETAKELHITEEEEDAALMALVQKYVEALTEQMRFTVMKDPVELDQKEKTAVCEVSIDTFNNDSYKELYEAGLQTWLDENMAKGNMPSEQEKLTFALELMAETMRDPALKRHIFNMYILLDYDEAAGAWTITNKNEFTVDFVI